MQKGILALLAVAMLVGGCSDGKLDDSRDRYLNVFGIPLPETPPQKGGVIGRVVQSDGRPAMWAQVYAKSSATGARINPGGATTNEKGGFYLGNLDPGTYSVFVVSASGQGVNFPVQIEAGQVFENDQIALTALARVSGNVALQDEPLLAGVLVYVPGTSFSAFTDQDGNYFLDVPAGTYTFRAERDTFQPYETKPLAITAATKIDMQLKANPWPNGKVTVANAEDGVVRGLTTKLHITTEPGVRHMRVTLLGTQSQVKAEKLNKWQPIKDSFELQHIGEGYTNLQFEFYDAFGKKSEPIYLTYYNTKLDKSWKIYQGFIEKPVTIKAGEKVYFLPCNCENASAPIAKDASIRLLTSLQAISVTPSKDAADDVNETGEVGGSTTQSSEAAPAMVGFSNVFTAPVTVESGAHLVGSAMFLSTLTINGTKASPVLWDWGNLDRPVYNANAIELGGKSTNVHYLHAKDLTFNASANGSTQIADSVMENFNFNQQVDIDINKPEAASSTVSFVHSRLSHGYLYMHCVRYDNSSDSASAGGNGGSPEFAAPAIELSAAASEFSGVSTYLYCTKSQTGILPSLHLTHNNFLDLAVGEYYFSSYAKTPDTSDDESVGELPDATEINYAVTDNHFREPSKLFRGVSDTNWPFSPNVETPWSDVGPR